MKDFKDFVLNNTLEDVANYCAAKALELGCDESDIGEKATDVVGRFYCPDDALAKRFGFLTEENLNDDCAEIARDAFVEAGEKFITTSTVVDELHKWYCVSRFNEGFYAGQIIFVDINALAARFRAFDNIDDGLVEVPY